MYVYRIFNKRNGRMYFGSTNNYMVRKSEHFSSLKKGTHHNWDLQRDFKKFGESSFVFEILHNDIFDRTKLLLKEYDLIIRHKGKCYNIHTDCPVFDPKEKQDWSIYRKKFVAPFANKKANKMLIKERELRRKKIGK